jgi:lipoprotein NlpD
MLAVQAAACTSPRHRAPVEVRGGESQPMAVATAPAEAASAPVAAGPASPPGEPASAPVPGYTVKPGDTLIRVGLETGQNWRDIARWNGLDNPNVLEVGQLLRVSPPDAEVAAATGPRPVTAPGRIDSKPLDARPDAGVSAPAAAMPPVPLAKPAATTPSSTREPDEELNWLWPASGPMVTPFDDSRNKGLSIGGKAGDPVLAAADGRVVYAGSGLRGYGNLVIVKHNNTFLSAYAHNQSLLVKEDQVVRRGQKIAEMGASDADRVKLHFEIRRQGKPVDPARYLPAR